MRNLVVIIVILLFADVAHSDPWKVDFSRRIQETPHSENTNSSEPSSTEVPANDQSIFSRIFSSEPASGDDSNQEIVILQTEKGFVPGKIQIHLGQSYKIDVVNVNEKEKNVSFVLDSFSEHHATYYGKIKSFTIRPQQSGVYTFQSPETAFQGQLVVLPTDKRPVKEFKIHSSPEPAQPDVRAPAAE